MIASCAPPIARDVSPCRCEALHRYRLGIPGDVSDRGYGLEAAPRYSSLIPIVRSAFRLPLQGMKCSIIVPRIHFLEALDEKVRVFLAAHEPADRVNARVSETAAPSAFAADSMERWPPAIGTTESASAWRRQMA